MTVFILCLYHTFDHRDHIKCSYLSVIQYNIVKVATVFVIVLSLLLFPSNKMTAYVTSSFFSPDDQCVIHVEGVVVLCLLPNGKSCCARRKMLL